MGGHPLDISQILLNKGIDLQKKYPPKATEQHKKKPSSDRPQQIQEEVKKEESQPVATSQNSNIEEVPATQAPKIDNQYWSKLNTESRKIFSSRVWKSVDFNPMLRELEDISKLSEKWLRWAIPTYVNGLKGGPIKEWLDGTNRDKDFHYVLVGEHLRYFKEIREQKKQEQESINTQQTDSNPAEQKELNEAIEELTEHINWFQEYIDKQS
jgi:hypothetical protein